jgi:hypothetical protein
MQFDARMKLALACVLATSVAPCLGEDQPRFADYGQAFENSIGNMSGKCKVQVETPEVSISASCVFRGAKIRIEGTSEAKANDAHQREIVGDFLVIFDGRFHHIWRKSEYRYLKTEDSVVRPQFAVTPYYWAHDGTLYDIYDRFDQMAASPKNAVQSVVSGDHHTVVIKDATKDPASGALVRIAQNDSFRPLEFRMWRAGGGPADPILNVNYVWEDSGDVAYPTQIVTMQAFRPGSDLKVVRRVVVSEFEQEPVTAAAFQFPKSELPFGTMVSTVIGPSGERVSSTTFVGGKDGKAEFQFRMHAFQFRMAREGGGGE